MAGPRYPEGLPIEDESALEEICRRQRVDRVVFAYSDVSHPHVMTLACRPLAPGADFTLLGPARTTLQAAIPVVAAVRTGCGKSPSARWLGGRLRMAGRRVAVVRHPMPADLSAADCTIEEREEYEPHVAAGHVVFAGADYAEVVARTAAEADVMVWGGGSNDFSFVRTDFHIVVTDALRPDHARGFLPRRGGDPHRRRRGRQQGERAPLYAASPHIGPVLPAVGYSPGQVAALQATLDRSDAEVVVAATPVDLARLVTVSKPIVRARHDFEDIDDPGLAVLIDHWMARTWPVR